MTEKKEFTLEDLFKKAGEIIRNSTVNIDSIEPDEKEIRIMQMQLGMKRLEKTIEAKDQQIKDLTMQLEALNNSVISKTTADDSNKLNMKEIIYDSILEILEILMKRDSQDNMEIAYLLGIIGNFVSKL